MAEVLFEYSGCLTAADGRRYRAQACGRERPGGQWEGWIEFLPEDIADTPRRSPRETTQPTRDAAAYWASGLTPVYIEGALERASKPLKLKQTVPSRPIYAEPEPRLAEPAARSTGASPAPSIVDPFSLFEKGETLLRQELQALAPRHIINVVKAYELSDQPESRLSRLSRSDLVDLIVVGVRGRIR